MISLAAARLPSLNSRDFASSSPFAKKGGIALPNSFGRQNGLSIGSTQSSTEPRCSRLPDCERHSAMTMQARLHSPSTCTTHPRLCAFVPAPQLSAPKFYWERSKTMLAISLSPSSFGPTTAIACGESESGARMFLRDVSSHWESNSWFAPCFSEGIRAKTARVQCCADCKAIGPPWRNG
jgi:hypothetical protein